jgi:FkbM family methyltransferase
MGRGVAFVRRNVAWAIRDRFPHRKVEREVLGVTMVLPWSHRLPDYTRGNAVYGRNLIDLAGALAETVPGPVTLLDVGANVGDSALSVLGAVDARVLAVEGDAEYIEYLRLNCGSDDRVTIVEALLSTADGLEPVTAVRSGGTTRFQPDAHGKSRPTVTAEQLRENNADFDELRLVKSDTDGYDVDLVPRIAEVWQDAHPVLFFEYDHALSRLAGNDPLAVWPALAALGYSTVAVWDNAGVPMGRTTVDKIGDQAEVLDRPLGRRKQHYWDVAVVHSSDERAEEAVEKLVPQDLTDPY